MRSHEIRSTGGSSSTKTVKQRPGALVFLKRPVGSIGAPKEVNASGNATAPMKLLFWLTLASYLLSNFSSDAHLHFFIGQRGAKHQILRIQILMLQRLSMRPFFMSGCQDC